MIQNPSEANVPKEPEEFPFFEEFPDCAGKKRRFKFEAHEIDGGWMVTAGEADREPGGYRFRGSSPYSPHAALGDLRADIRHALAIRYLDLAANPPLLTHDVMRGTVAYDRENDACGVVVDGEFLSMEVLGGMLSEYEGCDFELFIND